MGKIIKEVTSYIAACHSTTIRPGDVKSDVLYRVWGAKMVRKGVCIQPELQYLPPSSTAFKENVKRAHLQATMWQTALNTDPPDMSSYDYVWLKYDHFKSLQPKTIPHDQQFAPSVILKITHSPTLRCVLQLRISCPQWPVLNGVKG